MKLLFLLILCIIPFALTCQNNSLRVYGGWEPTGDHITANATLGISFRSGVASFLYIEPFLRAGHGTNFFGTRIGPNQYPGTYIGTGERYVFDGSVLHDPIEKGVSSNRVRDSQLFFLLGGGHFGIQSKGKYRAYAGAGISIGYYDIQDVTEGGDAIFSGTGDPTFIWYTIPHYQRGIGLQWSGAVGLERVWERWFCGLRGDLDAGGLGAPALGTRLSISFTIGVPL